MLCCVDDVSLSLSLSPHLVARAQNLHCIWSMRANSLIPFIYHVRHHCWLVPEGYKDEIVPLTGDRTKVMKI